MGAGGGQLHHTKHHQAYVNNLNAATEALEEAMGKGDVAKIIQLGGALKFNGGGHLNHSLFWENLAPAGAGGGVAPGGELGSLVEEQFGSLDALIAQFKAKAMGIQGSGWAWLGYDADAGRLVVTTTANQDPLLPTTGLVPLLGLDEWEHAFYKQYKNDKAAYTNAVWDVINWGAAEARLEAARQ